ncbi:MAG: endonuclease domain-containing protein [Bacteroidota bacterium]
MSLSRSSGLITVAKTVARELRRNQTHGEALFWKAVRGRRFHGKKFLRQHPILVDVSGRETFYVADFYSAELKLVIEIDGKVHEYQKERDTLRITVIVDRGLKVVRFRNEALETDIDGVLRELEHYL